MAFEGADAGAGDLATDLGALASVALTVGFAAGLTADFVAGFFAAGLARCVWGVALGDDAFTGISAFGRAGAWALLAVEGWVASAAGVDVEDVLEVVFMANEIF